MFIKKHLGVNIDHIATLRQDRCTVYPEPLQAAYLIQNAGADGIVIHPREDQRHIQKRDIYLIREACSLPLNMEMSLSDDIIHVALDICPEEVCIVSEKRGELILNQGIDLLSSQDKLAKFISQAQSKNIKVSILINPDEEFIKIASDLGIDSIKLNTGKFTNANTKFEQEHLFEELKYASQYAYSLGLQVNAGNGLNYENIRMIASISEIHTVHIGHAIISKSIFVGLDRAVRDMLQIIS